MNIKDLPGIDFVSLDKEVVVSRLMKLYTHITGRVLKRADPLRLFILVIASVIILLLHRINETGKQNLLAYAKGAVLDHIGVLVGVTRLDAQKAMATVRLTLSTAIGNRSIPKGTRFSTKDNVLFETTEDTLVLDGHDSIDMKVVCMEAGNIGNGYTPGMITIVVDRLPYVAAVTNTTTSDGGADIESDEHFRQRIHEAPESFSCAGSSGAYEYHTKKVSANIENVLVVSPEPGKVVVYPIMIGGVMPSTEIINAVTIALSDKTVRPLTDHVAVQAPGEKLYDISFKYFINTEDRDRILTIQRDVELAVQDYVVWQRSVVGRDINPSELTRRIMAAGVKRVEITSPIFTRVKSGTEADSYGVELAVLRNKTVTFGGYEDE